MLRNTILSLVLVVFVTISLLITDCEAKSPPESLQIGILKKGDCSEKKASRGKQISVHYTGKLFSNGEKFDSSLDRGDPFQFTLGVGQVIKGWDQGVLGMCLGEKRKLTIPSDLGYGERGAPPTIPPNSALVFEVELIDVIEKGGDSSHYPDEF